PGRPRRLARGPAGQAGPPDQQGSAARRTGACRPRRADRESTGLPQPGRAGAAAPPPESCRTASGIAVGRSRGRRFVMKKIAILLFIIALGVGGFGFWYVHRGNGSAGQFRVVELRRGDLLATISATGTIQPEDVVDVGAQVAGTIEKFGIDRKPGLLNSGDQRTLGGAVAGAGAVAALADQRKPVDFNSE